jgi:GNAT superfamily N-acetyltransferase
MSIWIREAVLADAEVLGALMLSSKAVHGYDASFLEACRSELQVTADRLCSERIRVAVLEGQAVGVAALALADDEAELTALFITPGQLGQGIGHALWQDALEYARSEGARRLRIDSDPHVVHWYRARGAELRGYSASGSIPGRLLPCLELLLVVP